MKKKLILSLIVAIGISNNMSAQFSFSVSPGMNLSGAQFGYKIADRFVPFVGFQYMSANFEYERSGYQYSGTFPSVLEEYNYSDEIKTHILLPTIGLKSFIIKREKLRAHVSLSGTKPIIRAKYVEDGEEVDDYGDYVSKIKLIAGETAFGVEYFFDEHFSVGGEFGLRFFKAHFEDSYDDMIFNPNTGIYESHQVDLKYSSKISPTFHRITVNFYF